MSLVENNKLGIVVEALQEYFEVDQRRIALEKELKELNEVGVSTKLYDGKHHAWVSTVRRLNQLRQQISAF